MGSKKNTFYTIRFRRNTAKRFKQFSRTIASTYSEALEEIIDFFEWHGFLPNDRFEKSISREILKNRQRTDANIAILKNIEKSQTQPSASMLQLLFEGMPKKRQQPKLVEIAPEEQANNKEYQQALELIELRSQCTSYQQEIQQVKRDFIRVVGKVEVVKTPFGKSKLILDMTPEAFEQLKQQIS